MNVFGSLVRVGNAVASRRRNLWFQLLGMRLPGYVWMRRVSIPRQWSDITLARGVSLDDGVVLLSSGAARPDRIVIGRGTYINRYTIIDASEQIEIGEDCMIGPQCYITDHDHAHEPGRPVNAQPLVGAPVQIGRNVWLGAGVIVLKGVTIGDQVVVGAGAVVTKSIPSGAKVAGVPARSLNLSLRPAAMPE